MTRLNAEIRKIVEKPEIKARLGRFVNEQLIRWERLIKDVRIEKQ